MQVIIIGVGKEAFALEHIHKAIEIMDEQREPSIIDPVERHLIESIPDKMQEICITERKIITIQRETEKNRNYQTEKNYVQRIKTHSNRKAIKTVKSNRKK